MLRTFGLFLFPSLSAPRTSHPLFLLPLLLSRSLNLIRLVLLRDEPRRALARLNGFLQESPLFSFLYNKKKVVEQSALAEQEKSWYVRTRMAPITIGAISSVRRLYRAFSV